jgi:hypothetical protein
MAQYFRQQRRDSLWHFMSPWRSADKAQVAVSNTQLKVYHKLLSSPGSSPGTRYHDLGAGYYEQRAQARRKTRYHLAQLDALGYDVDLIPSQGSHDGSTRPGPAPAA